MIWKTNKLLFIFDKRKNLNLKEERLAKEEKKARPKIKKKKKMKRNLEENPNATTLSEV